MNSELESGGMDRAVEDHGQLRAVGDVNYPVAAYDARVKLVQALEVDLLKYAQVNLEGFEVLLALHLASSGQQVRVRSAWLRREIEISDSGLYRRVRAKPFESQWLSLEPDDASSSAKSTSIKLSEQGRMKWTEVLRCLRGAGTKWLVGIPEEGLREHLAVLWIWHQRLGALRSLRRESAMADAQLEIRESAQSALSKWGDASALPAGHADPLANILGLIQVERSLRALLKDRLKSTSLGLPQADILAYLGLENTERQSESSQTNEGRETKTDGTIPGQRQTAVWVDYSELRRGLSYSIGVSQPLFSRWLAELAQEELVEFSWKVMGRASHKRKVPHPEAPLDSENQPDLRRKFVRITAKGGRRIKPIWDDYVEVADQLCQGIPKKWLESSEKVHQALQQRCEPGWWERIEPSEIDIWTSPESRLQPLAARVQTMPQSAPPVAQVERPTIHRSLMLESPRQVKGEIPGDPSTRERLSGSTSISEYHRDVPSLLGTSSSKEPEAAKPDWPSTDHQVRMFLDFLYESGGKATHEEIRSHLRMFDPDDYQELCDLLRERGWIKTRPGGLTVTLTIDLSSTQPSFTHT